MAAPGWLRTPTPVNGDPRPDRRLRAIADAQLAVSAVEVAAGDVHHELCAQAMRLTGADGAAVGLRDGAEFVHLGTAGSAAADAGTRRPIDGSFLGRCLTEGGALRCVDTLQDPRVTGSAYRAPAVRSMVVLPLRRAAATIGALTVVSGRPGAFTVEDQTVLEVLIAPFGAALDNAYRAAAAHLNATTDPITGLGNRRFAEHELRRSLRRQQRSDGELAVLYVDLDGLADINDRHGHVVGDRVLGGVASRIQSVLRGSDTAARYGGDEFVVICERLATPGDAARVAERVLAAVREPYPAGLDEPVRVNAHVGIAFADPWTTAAELFAAADRARQEAKRAGGGYATAVPYSVPAALPVAPGPSTAPAALRTAGVATVCAP